MLSEKHVNHYAQASSVDSLVAERDIVLTYVLRLLAEESLLSHLAFKGGTCLKKVYFGKTGRFSMDLDFTSLDIELDKFRSGFRSLLKDRKHYEISFAIEDEYESSQSSYGAEIAYSHAWNSSRFDIEVSFREKPILSLLEQPLLRELYFRYSEFQPFRVPCLQREEVLAEKIRASFQRIRARDLYDLYLFATIASYDKNKARALVVLKCWNSHDPFDANRLLAKVSEEKYDWDDLQRLVRLQLLPSEEKIVQTVLTHYAYLRNLDNDLARVVADSKRHKELPLVNGLVDQLP